MAWFTDRHCFLLAVMIYGLSTVYSVFLWRMGFRKDDHVNYFLLLAAFALHTVAMFKRGFSHQPMPRQQSLRSHHVRRLDHCRGLSRHRPAAAAAVPRRVCVAGAVCHRRVCVDARAGSAARAEAGIFRRVDQSACGDDSAGLRRVRPRRGGGGNVFDAAARLEIPQTPRRAVAAAADSTAGNHHQPAGARRALFFSPSAWRPADICPAAKTPATGRTRRWSGPFSCGWFIWRCWSCAGCACRQAAALPSASSARSRFCS